MEQVRRWHIYPDLEQFEARASEAILRIADAAIARAGSFAIVLAGGGTPRRIYAHLARAAVDWPRWHVYFGDERCVPAGDSTRNDRMAGEAWLDRVSIPRAQIHPIPAERGAVEAAVQYASVIAPVAEFDLVLLGLGEDGHTASLFPGQPADGDAAVIAVHDAPKAPRERVSLSAARLSRARQVLYIVAGSGKRDAVAAWRRGDPIPASRIVPPAGVDVLLDADAWPERFV